MKQVLPVSLTIGEYVERVIKAKHERGDAVCECQGQDGVWAIVLTRKEKQAQGISTGRKRSGRAPVAQVHAEQPLSEAEEVAQEEANRRNDAIDAGTYKPSEAQDEPFDATERVGPATRCTYCGQMSVLGGVCLNCKRPDPLAVKREGDGTLHDGSQEAIQQEAQAPEAVADTQEETKSDSSEMPDF